MKLFFFTFIIDIDQMILFKEHLWGNTFTITTEYFYTFVCLKTEVKV